MANYHIVSKDNGWKIIGVKSDKIYKTKKEAVQFALEIARIQKKILIIHSKDGEVTKVVSFDDRQSRGKLLSAKGKRRLNSENVRNSIADVISERRGI